MSLTAAVPILWKPVPGGGLPAEVP